MADKAKLKEVLLYHVVPGDVNAEAGKALKISTRDKQVYINGVKVILPPANQEAK